MNNNFNNNEAANNNSNNGGFIMANNTIENVQIFAEVVKGAMQLRLGAGYEVEVKETFKNNSVQLTGLIIREQGVNIAPVIYLNGAFQEYQNGRSITELFDSIEEVYRRTKQSKDFDVASLMDFNRVKNNICVKLVSAEKNKELLDLAPHKFIQDMVMLYYVLIDCDTENTATVTIRNDLLDKWNVTAEEIHDLAVENTQRLNRGVVQSMASVVTEILARQMDEADAKQFYDLAIHEDDIAPMYVASNVKKHMGAIVIAYPGLLKAVSEKFGGDFYILPSSIHETIMVPSNIGMSVEMLRDMVVEVNITQVAPEEVLTDSVYRYDSKHDQIVLA